MMPFVAFNLEVNYALYIHRGLETNFVGAHTLYDLCVALESEMGTTFFLLSPPPPMFSRFLRPYRISKF